MKAHLITILTMSLGGITLVSAAKMDVDQGRSRIQVDASATGHSFTGTLDKYTIAAAGNSATNRPESLSLTWNFSDLKTADEKRDKEMIKWLGGGKPTGSFKFTKSWGETSTGGTAQGVLTIHGVSKTVAFPYTVTNKDGWVTLGGKVSMDYKDFKLPLIRSMAVMTVDPKLVIRFHVVGKLK